MILTHPNNMKSTYMYDVTGQKVFIELYIR